MAQPRVPPSLWALLAVGAAVRLVLAFTTDGQAFDIAVLADLRAALDDAPLHVYAAPLGPADIAWPYPPGFFPLTWLAGLAADVTGLEYTSLVRLPSVVADLAVAVVVHDALGRRGASERTRLAAAALVALGPSFVAISGFHGQLDSLAILPAVLAVAVWDRVGSPRRALYAGALIGVGFLIKTTPVFVLLALLPGVRSRREAATLLGAAAAVALPVLAPWLITTTDAMVEGLRYRGFPGTSGLSILLQPDLAKQLTRPVPKSGLVMALYDAGPLLVPAALVAVSAFTTRWGAAWSTAERASLLWLAFYVVTPVFFFQYLVWGLPFLLLAGRLRLAALVQLVALVPMVLFYRAPWESEAVAIPYGGLMVGLWALFAVAFVLVVRSHRGGQPRLPRPSPRVAEGGVLVLLLAVGFAPLVAMLIHSAGPERVFGGVDGPFPADQFQYLAWIREYGTSLLAGNDLDLAPSDGVFLHPMFLLSGLGTRLGLSVELAYLLWKPVAIVALFLGCRAYAHRFLDGMTERLVALVVAIFFAAPFVVVDLDVGSAAGEMFPAGLLWGYVPSAIAVALMPLFLLGVERLATRPSSAREVAAVAACGALCSWLHPWQGEVLLVAVAGGVLLARRRDLRWVSVAVACAATLAPLVYYLVLSISDPAWDLAAAANERVGQVALWRVLLALLPLAALAALAVRPPRDLGEALLLAWAPATLLVFVALSPSVPAHALEGVSIPLAVLAARALVARPALAAAAAFLLTVPGGLKFGDVLRDIVRASGQAHYLVPDERRALDHLDRLPEGGGVLTSVRLGALVPSATGRPSWVAHPSWTRDFARRAQLSSALLQGTLPADQAAALVASSGARFVLVDCFSTPAGLRGVALDGSFGCARVYRVTR